MANLFSNPSHTAKIGYNGFDMSKLVTFSSTTGELRPIYFDILQPGDKIRATSELRTRTLPLATPVMCDIVERIEWFFVPIDQIFHRFGEWFHGIADAKSSAMAGEISQFLPHFVPSALASIFSELYDNPTDYKDKFGYTDTYQRVLEDFGFPTWFLEDPHHKKYPISISPLVGCAYQKVYNDFYRLTEREASNPSDFNLDIFYDAPYLTGAGRFYNFFKLQYRPRRKDFFTYNLVSPIFGNQGINSSPNVDLTSSFKQWLISGLNYSTISSTPAVDNSTPSAIRVNTTPLGSTYNLSPTAIRTSFAVDKLLSITQRNAKRVDAQQLAHFGVNLNDGLGTEVKFLGRSESSIRIGDVISTSDTSETGGQPLGSLAGKGYNYNKSGNISYTADRHGILLAIYSAEPLSDYPEYGLDPLTTLVNPYDFPRPEFDNLGMQPIFGQSLMLFPSMENYSTTWNSSVIGWQYRWSEWKTKKNSVTGALRHGRSLANWKIQFFRDYTVNGVDNNFYFVSPNDLDTVMPANYNFSGHSDAAAYNTDPLIHECYFDVKKSSKMSTYGLEQL